MLEYEAEGILWHKGKGAHRRYLVLWKGYPLTEATWEPAVHLEHAPDILEDYLRQVQQQENRTRNRRDVLRRSGFHGGDFEATGAIRDG